MLKMKYNQQIVYVYTLLQKSLDNDDIRVKFSPEQILLEPLETSKERYEIRQYIYYNHCIKLLCQG